MPEARVLIATAALAAGLSGCMFDNSERIERERSRAGAEARLAQAEDDLKRVQASCQDLERALNQERDARAALQQRLAALERPAPEPPKPVAAKPAPARSEADEERPSGDAAVLAKIQAALQKAGYDPGPADGKMGHKTKQALMSFQKDNGLKPDGVVGPRTLDRLKGYLEEHGPAR